MSRANPFDMQPADGLPRHDFFKRTTFSADLPPHRAQKTNWPVFHKE
jgi:hypothetical protein